MHHRPFRLKRRIAMTLLVKVLALTLLWWFVVRDHRTHPDHRSVETHFLASTPSTPANTSAGASGEGSPEFTRGTPR